ncbi:Arpin [Lamellibrachia satsuma]|nr:Arpin [Lamellibrachia satsuma]
MSRLYYDQPLQSAPVATFQWSGKWVPTEFQRGNGAIVEGTIVTRSRHIIIDSTQTKARYVILQLRFIRGCRRQFDKSGKEMEPDFSETTKVRTGFLHSSYKVTEKGDSVLLSTKQMKALLNNNANLLAISQNCNSDGCLALWTTERLLERIELEDNEHVQIKTLGDGPFTDSLVKMTAKSRTVLKNTLSAAPAAPPDKPGASWTDKVMAVKMQSASQDAPLPQDDVEGVADEEWDD